MKKLILLFGLLPIISLAATDVILKEYGVATSVNLCLYDYNTPVDEVDSTTFTFAAGDVTVMLDDGTPANINGLPTDEGTCLSVALTAGEVTSAKTLVRIVDQTAPAVWMDESFTIETYGNASAMHPDIDIAAVQSDLDTITGTNGVFIDDDAITAAKIAADAIGASELAADAAAEIWDVECEDQGGGYSCREAMSIILAEAAGTAVYTSGTRTWVVSDPSGTETRLTLVYGAELDGDRTTSTPAPFTP